jgi:hypothetical protein
LADCFHPGASGSTGGAAFWGCPECAEIGSPEAIAVPKKPSCGFLDVCESWLIGEFVELAPAVEDELQLGEQGVCMKSNAPVERDQIPIEVVEDLEPGWLFREKNGEAAGEWFNVAGVITDFWQDVFKEPGFSARPCDGWFYLVCYDALLDGAFCAWVWLI